MKRLSFRLSTLMGSTIACVVGAHKSCDGTASSRVPLDRNIICLCRCHYRMKV